MCHIFFLNLLDRNFYTCAFVSAELYQSKLAFAQSFFQLIEVEYVGVAHALLQSLNPQSLFLCGVEVDYS